MPRAHRHPQATTAGRLLVIATALALPLGLLGTGAAMATPVPAAPAPGATVLNSVTTTTVASTLDVRAQTGQWALAQGSIDTSRNRLYIGVASAQPKVAQVDLTTGVATVIPLAATAAYAAFDTAVSPLDGTVYVSHNSYLPGISVLDPSQTYAGAPLPPVITTGLAQNPQFLDVGRDGRVYALHLGEGTVSVIGASTSADRLNVVQTLTGLRTSEGSMVIDADRDRLYVVSPVSRTLTVIDTASVPAAVLGVITLADAPVGVGVDAQTGQVLVSSTVSNTVSWLALATDHQSATVTRTELLAPPPPAVDPDGWSQPSSISVRADGTTFVLTQVYDWPAARSQVTVIPAVVSTATPISLVTVGKGASGGILDPRAGGTVYVPNGSQGTLSEISDVTLSTYATTAELGSAGTLRATVTRSDARAFAGAVTFTGTSTATALGVVTVDASGTADLPVSAQPVGTLDFTAAVTVPTGIALSAAGSLTTAKAASSTTLVLETPSALEGESLSATVTVSGSAGVTAHGPFTITSQSGDVLASGTIVDGHATVTFVAPPAGTTPLVARFAGDDSYQPSVSSSVDAIVTARTPAATAPVSAGTVGSSSSVSVSGFLPGETITLTLHSDPVLLGTIRADRVGSGTLAFTIPNVDAGLHHIIAVGDTSGRVADVPYSVAAAVLPEPTPTTPTPTPTPTPTATPTPSATATPTPAHPAATAATAATAADPSGLATTGPNLGAALWLGFLLLAGGAAVWAASARRARRVV